MLTPVVCQRKEYTCTVGSSGGGTPVQAANKIRAIIFDGYEKRFDPSTKALIDRHPSTDP